MDYTERPVFFSQGIRTQHPVKIIWLKDHHVLRAVHVIVYFLIQLKQARRRSYGPVMFQPCG